MMREKVSIVIPVYKSADTIKRCVNSIMKGTYQNIQVILVEDCSKDGTWNVCKELSETHEQVVCIQNSQNKGVSYTRNQGLQMADGKYLMFVDSDDWVGIDFVEKMVDAFEENDGMTPICGYVNHDEKKNHSTDIFGWEFQEGQQIHEVKDTIVRLYEQRLLQIIWNKLFLLSIVKENNIQFDETIQVGEDFRFLLEYLLQYERKQFVFLNMPLYHYSRDNDESLATTFTSIHIEEPMRNLRTMYELSEINQKQIDDIMKDEYKKQLDEYAYAIMHDDKISKKEKKEKIREIGKSGWRELYNNHRKLIVKEIIINLKNVRKK